MPYYYYYYHPCSESAAQVVLFSVVFVGVCFCLFVNAINVEPFEISSFIAARYMYGQKLGPIRKMAAFRYTG